MPAGTWDSPRRNPDVVVAEPDENLGLAEHPFRVADEEKRQLVLDHDNHDHLVRAVLKRRGLRRTAVVREAELLGLLTTPRAAPIGVHGVDPDDAPDGLGGVGAVSGDQQDPGQPGTAQGPERAGWYAVDGGCGSRDTVDRLPDPADLQASLIGHDLTEVASTRADLSAKLGGLESPFLVLRIGVAEPTTRVPASPRRNPEDAIEFDT